MRANHLVREAVFLLLLYLVSQSVSLNESERAEEREKNTFSHVISSLPSSQIGFLALSELPR